MQFQNYSLSPETLSQSKGYVSCTYEQKGLLVELLNLIWQNEKQFSLQIKDDIFIKLGVSEDKIDELITLVSNQQILDKQLCLEIGDFVYHSQILEKSYKSQHMQLLRDQEVTQRMLKSQKQSTSMFEALQKNRKGHELAMDYLKPQDRELVTYNGWFPTARFDSNGQIYFVRGFFKEMLVADFPLVNIDIELNKIFSYLTHKPERRKNVAFMNKFVRVWMENAANPSFGSKETPVQQADKVEDELDRLLSLEVAS